MLKVNCTDFLDSWQGRRRNKEMPRLAELKIGIFIFFIRYIIFSKTHSELLRVFLLVCVFRIILASTCMQKYFITLLRALLCLPGCSAQCGTVVLACIAPTPAPGSQTELHPPRQWLKNMHFYDFLWMLRRWPGRWHSCATYRVVFSQPKECCSQSMLFCSTRMHCSYNVIILGK